MFPVSFFQLPSIHSMEKYYEKKKKGLVLTYETNTQTPPNKEPRQKKEKTRECGLFYLLFGRFTHTS